MLTAEEARWVRLLHSSNDADALKCTLSTFSVPLCYMLETVKSETARATVGDGCG
jgi:hypothetical protein